MGDLGSKKLQAAVQPMAALGPTLDAAGAPGAGASTPIEVRQRLGRFVVLDKLGTGGMGTVFATYDEQLDRKVALKLLHSTGVEQEALRQRVLREAQALARVALAAGSHPNRAARR